jgi:hypothetical protein
MSDTTDQVIASLPEGPIDPAFAARVEREARAALVAEARPLARLDRFTMGWLVPVGLSICACAYTVELVRRLGAVYVAHG